MPYIEPYPALFLLEYHNARLNQWKRKDLNTDNPVRAETNEERVALHEVRNGAISYSRQRRLEPSAYTRLNVRF
jgi:hypothetical protein